MNLLRPVLLSLLCLAAFTVSASAECAWVLWSYRWGESGEQYDINTVYQSRVECETKMVSTIATVLKGSGMVVTGDFPGSHEVSAVQGNRSWRFFCLPDTVDPRGPKGK